MSNRVCNVFADTQVGSAFDLNGLNVRVRVTGADGKVTWPASATQFAKGYTTRFNRKAVAKGQSRVEAMNFINQKVAELSIDDGRKIEIESYTDSTVTEAVVEENVQVASTATVTLSRQEAADRLGISRNALNKRIARGTVTVTDTGDVVL